MEYILYRYNPWWDNKCSLSGIINRPELLMIMKKHFGTRHIVFLTGLRRVGKTTLMKLFIRDLIEKEKINPSTVFYFSMDDYVLSKKTIIEIVEEFRKINKISFKEKVYLFFDEITFKPDFEQQLKNIYDTHNAKIYVSSSIASVLKSKKAFLTGRNIILEILPLDFNEYLKFINVTIDKSDYHLVDKYFEDYMATGGIPEYVLNKDTGYLQELVDDIIYKDIVAYYKIKDPDILKDFFVLLMERSGKSVSINKVANILKISPDTARRYLEMFENTYLIYLVPRYRKTNEKILAPKKVYAADLGIKALFTGFRDKGSFFENYVFLKIKQHHPCYVYKDSVEIDFYFNKTLINKPADILNL